MADLLEIEGLWAGYGEAVVLSDIGLCVPDGQSLALLGRNGTGKTTLINSIVGLTTHKSGSIRLDGRDITRERPERRSQQSRQRVSPGDHAQPPSLPRPIISLTAQASPGERDLPHSVARPASRAPAAMRHRDRPRGLPLTPSCNNWRCEIRVINHHIRPGLWLILAQVYLLTFDVASIRRSRRIGRSSPPWPARCTARDRDFERCIEEYRKIPHAAQLLPMKE